MTRRFWVLIHRYAGLYMAFILIVAGISGSLLAFYQEINAWLNPEIYSIPAPAGKARLDSFELRERAAALVPQGQITWLPLHPQTGEAFTAYFVPRTDPASGKPYELGFSAIILDPYSGAEITRIQAGWWPLSPARM